MSDAKKIEWKSGRVCHYVIGELFNMKQNITKMFFEDVIGKDLGRSDSLNRNTLRYKNEIVEGPVIGSPSTLSVDGTIALMASYGEFPIPEEVRKYLVKCWEEDMIDEEKFPISAETFERGKAILDAFIEAGIPYYSACAMTGATFVECSWDVHTHNTAENEGKGASSTSNWTGCGEGLFGLTYWSQKVAIIISLGFNKTKGIPDTPDKYNDKRARHLCDLDEADWIEIAQEYLKKTAKKHYDVLFFEDEPENEDDLTEILCASYLWKAACGLDPTLENVEITTQRYKDTHRRMYGDKSVHDGFAKQICTSIALDQYLHGAEKIDFNQLGMDIKYDIDGIEVSTIPVYARSQYRRNYYMNNIMNNVNRIVSKGNFKDYDGPVDGSIGYAGIPQGKGKTMAPNEMYWPFYVFGFGASPKARPEKAFAQRTGVECCKLAINTVLGYLDRGCKTIGDVVCKYHTGVSTYDKFIEHYSSIAGINDIADGRFVSSEEMIERQNRYQQHLVKYVHMSNKTPLTRTYAVLFPLITFISRQEQSVNCEEACKIALKELGIT